MIRIDHLCFVFFSLTFLAKFNPDDIQNQVNVTYTHVFVNNSMKEQKLMDRVKIPNMNRIALATISTNEKQAL
jgi:hypothetical protein